eukprot:scaffold135171_cov133-Phaeocystis_antarctica.AAC.1
MRAVCTVATPCSSASRSSPPSATYALLSIRQETFALSDVNKLVIRCAWAGTSAFASAGYGSSW